MEPRGEQDTKQRTGSFESGFSLPELLVVIAMMAIFITFAGPAFNESYRAYKVRSSALELSDSLRAARQVAVATQTLNSLVVNTAGASYSWTDSKGRLRTTNLQSPVRFVAATPATVTFASNGTVSTGAATISLQNTINGTRADRWTLDLNTVGRVTSTYSQVAP